MRIEEARPDLVNFPLCFYHTLRTKYGVSHETAVEQFLYLYCKDDTDFARRLSRRQVFKQRRV